MTRHLRFSRASLTLALVAAVLAAATVGVAVASTSTGTPTSTGIIHVLSTGPATGNGGHIIITGEIGDSGTSYSANASGVKSGNGTYVKLILKQGTILLNKAKLNKTIGKAYGSASVNSATCSATISASGSVSIVSGTGSYSHLSGNVHVTVTAAFVLGKYTTGKHKGQCNESANPISALQVVVGSGLVQLT